MPYAKALRCRECGREYRLEPLHVCEFCFGPLEVSYDYEAMHRNITRETIERGPLSVWRYADLLPVDPEFAVDINAGFTPLIRAKNLGEHLGLKNLYIKNDCANPTWSFKDRVVTVAATKAREFGFTTLACASTGNLANSVSAHAAAAGLDAYVFIPSDLERGKIVGSSVYGATLVAVDGNYDDVNRLCSELADKYQLGLRQHQHAPVLRRGLEDAGLRGRGAARLARAGPRRRADGVGLALREDLEGPAGAGEALAHRQRADEDVRRAGARLLADRHRVRARHDEHPPRAAEDDRQVAGDRQPGRRLLRAEGDGGVRRLRRRVRGRGDRRRHQAARRERGHLRRDGGRRRHRRPARSWRSTARSRPTS